MYRLRSKVLIFLIAEVFLPALSVSAYAIDRDGRIGDESSAGCSISLEIEDTLKLEPGSLNGFSVKRTNEAEIPVAHLARVQNGRLDYVTTLLGSERFDIGAFDHGDRRRAYSLIISPE